MNKILRNVCVTALAMIGIIANAQTVVTFVPNETKGKSSANDWPDKMTKDGITIESTNAAFNANGNKHYRFYQNSTTTITSTAGNITKIEFTCDIDNKGKYGSNGFDGTEGYTFTEDKKEGTWVGNATSDDYDVVGIVTSVYKGTPSINIISIKKNVPNAIENIEVAKNENAPIYNLAGQRVDKNYKGVVIKNGKKFINKQWILNYDRLHPITLEVLPIKRSTSFHKY